VSNHQTVSKTKRSVSGQWPHKRMPEVLDCEHACTERAIEQLLQLENPIELLSKALPVRCVRVEAVEALRC
jgi:hypothetical protein